MIQPFAKVFDTPTSQMVMYIDDFTDQMKTTVVHIFDVDGFKAVFRADCDTDEMAREMFDAAEQPYADSLVETFTTKIRERESSHERVAESER